MPIRELCFDTETTGLSFTEDRVIEIGIVETIDLLRTGRSFHCYLNPERRVSPGAVRVHGITDDQLVDKPLFVEVVIDFLSFIGTDRIVAHNAKFDLGMLNAELARIGLDPLQNEVVDTLVLSRQVKKGGRHDLDSLCRHFGVDITRRTKHGALLDAEILADLYLELKGGRQTGLDLSVQEEKKAVVQSSYGERKFISRISAAEKEAHTAFVASLGRDSMWSRYAESDQALAA